ncbi:nucleotide exchange factor GrpE [Pediococcus pentosaceus]|jgi:molecular chaperone GrpE|uniref:Protein GrpE n=2 Tax=Pediococcus pentosaceus TaxID=1255 RepID=A0ABD7X728_PEDPE|nr:nucleotide exchange factor GrpE [Pediococcus pentosaceus]AXR43412.1 nucleotide exchange factor GrpE [Pediococcus pentosaceus]KAF0519902.1 nucleotide exchange factor GrpE [Pediococcus pentosaceus]KRN49049.1 molecular chaperone GrpE (heat shock protein) [Pediococcus pentosaceus]MBF7102386.1 nucleotide exchange factor GrpE [Pediococcus pentosaceus]MBF7110864.1 nucleotide exchange factor GrpE [Pediococcus pentosaceus]
MIVRRIELAKEKKEEVKEEEVSEATSTEGSADVESTNNDDSTTETQATTALDDIKKVEAERDELSDKYIRAQAEIVNMRRRNEKEQASLIKYDGQKLAKAILPALDNLERALAVESASEQLLKGVKMVQTDLLKALKENHVAEIEAEGQAFDPNMHQAVQTVPADDDHPADTVVQVLQKGYILKDRVLRPAMVIVAQ